MFHNLQITNQPFFYLFLAGSLLLSLGYVWGKRKNTRIHLSTFNAVTDILKPKDQVFTNIGGLTGYHASIIPEKSSVVKKVDLTLTLLPRQSWLYLPLSMLITKYDRLYINMFFGKKIRNKFEEGHLVESGFSKTDLGRISDPGRFRIKPVKWGGRDFLMYIHGDGGTTEELLGLLMKKITDPLPVKHVALVPGENKAYMFMIPKYGFVSGIFGSFYSWVCSLAENRKSLSE